jgi:hypothetical protein
MIDAADVEKPIDRTVRPLEVPRTGDELPLRQMELQVL